MWISIAGVIAPPMLGLIGTVVGMRSSFGEVSSTGLADPHSLVEGISSAVVSTAWGLAISLIALIVFFGVLIRYLTLPKVSAQSHDYT